MAYAPPPDMVALVRRRYAEGAFVKAIVAESGIKNLNISIAAWPDSIPTAPA